MDKSEEIGSAQNSPLDHSEEVPDPLAAFFRVTEEEFRKEHGALVDIIEGRTAGQVPAKFPEILLKLHVGNKGRGAKPIWYKRLKGACDKLRKQQVAAAAALVPKKPQTIEKRETVTRAAKNAAVRQKSAESNPPMPKVLIKQKPVQKKAPPFVTGNVNVPQRPRLGRRALTNPKCGKKVAQPVVVTPKVPSESEERPVIVAKRSKHGLLSTKNNLSFCRKHLEDQDVSFMETQRAFGFFKDAYADFPQTGRICDTIDSLSDFQDFACGYLMNSLHAAFTVNGEYCFRNYTSVYDALSLTITNMLNDESISFLDAAVDSMDTDQPVQQDEQTDSTVYVEMLDKVTLKPKLSTWRYLPQLGEDQHTYKCISNMSALSFRPSNDLAGPVIKAFQEMITNQLKSDKFDMITGQVDENQYDVIFVGPCSSNKLDQEQANLISAAAKWTSVPMSTRIRVMMYPAYLESDKKWVLFILAYRRGEFEQVAVFNPCGNSKEWQDHVKYLMQSSIHRQLGGNSDLVKHVHVFSLLLKTTNIPSFHTEPYYIGFIHITKPQIPNLTEEFNSGLAILAYYKLVLPDNSETKLAESEGCMRKLANINVNDDFRFWIFSCLLASTIEKVVILEESKY